MKRLLPVAALATLAFVGLSCGGNPVASKQPGALTIRLTAPPANAGVDSAIVLTIAGPAPLTGATAGSGLRLFSQPLGGTTTRFALTGPLSNGATLFTIDVADVSAFSQYAGTIQGVATGDATLRSGLSGYALAVLR